MLCVRLWSDQRVEVRLHRTWIAAVVTQADVAVRTHPQHRHAHDSELSRHRFIDPPNLRTVRTRAEADDRIDCHAGAPLELRDQVADPARLRLRTAEDNQSVAPMVGELV
jgi:hypothetical protein